MYLRRGGDSRRSRGPCSRRAATWPAGVLSAVREHGPATRVASCGTRRARLGGQPLAGRGVSDHAWQAPVPAVQAGRLAAVREPLAAATGTELGPPDLRHAHRIPTGVISNHRTSSTVFAGP